MFHKKDKVIFEPMSKPFLWACLWFLLVSPKVNSFSTNSWPSWTSPPSTELRPYGIWTRTQRRRCPVADRWDWKTCRAALARWASQCRRRTRPSQWRRWRRWRAGSRRWLRPLRLWCTANRARRRCTYLNFSWTSKRAGRRRTTSSDTSSPTQSESDWVLGLVSCGGGGANKGGALRVNPDPLWSSSSSLFSDGLMQPSCHCC